MIQNGKKKQKPSSVKKINVRGWEVLKQSDEGTYPIFTYQIATRIKKKLATNVAVVGEAGIGKSYQAIQIAMMQDRKFNPEKQVVFGLSGFMEAVMKLKMGKPIVFDEPSYAMGKRDWYKEINKALVLTIESFRFKVHPLFIPIINVNLLDRSVRNYLLQYQVHVLDRGFARVFRINPSQRSDKIYQYYLCDLKYGILNDVGCKKDTCLGCRRLKGCKSWRASYERKKASVQEGRYSQTMDESQLRDTKELSISELEEMAYKIKDLFMDDNKIDTIKLIVAMDDEHNVKLSQYKAMQIRKRIEMHNPDIP